MYIFVLSAATSFLEIFINVDTKHFFCKQNIPSSTSVMLQHKTFNINLFVHNLFSCSMLFRFEFAFLILSSSDDHNFLCCFISQNFTLFGLVLSRHGLDVDSCQQSFHSVFR